MAITQLHETIRSLSLCEQSALDYWLNAMGYMLVHHNGIERVTIERMPGSVVRESRDDVAFIRGFVAGFAKGCGAPHGY